MKAPRDVRKHNDQFLKHEECLCSHPHPRYKSKVMYKDTHSNATSFIGDLVNATNKYQ